MALLTIENIPAGAKFDETRRTLNSLEALDSLDAVLMEFLDQLQAAGPPRSEIFLKVSGFRRIENGVEVVDKEKQFSFLYDVQGKPSLLDGLVDDPVLVDSWELMFAGAVNSLFRRELEILGEVRKNNSLVNVYNLIGNSDFNLNNIPKFLDDLGEPIWNEEGEFVGMTLMMYLTKDGRQVEVSVDILKNLDGIPTIRRTATPNANKIVIDLDNLEIATGSTGGVLVDKRKLPPSTPKELETLEKEISFGDKVADFQENNDKLLLATLEKTPAVDGIWEITGRGVQLKTITFNKLLYNINKAYSNANTNASTTFWKGKGIDIYLEVTNADIAAVLKRYNKALMFNNPPILDNSNTKTVRNIVVSCNDGFVKLRVPGV